MILNRLGKKTKLASEIIKHFPPHECYIEPFFGAGGLFFNKPKAKYNIMNDIDSEVSNLFFVLLDKTEELVAGIELMPRHQDILEHFKKNKYDDPVKKAMRFLFWSNYTFMGKPSSIKVGTDNNMKQILLDRIELTKKHLFDIQFLNKDFRKFFVSYQDRNPATTFYYCDPPYLDTMDNYSDSFTETDSFDLFECLMKTGSKFANLIMILF